jgi:TolB-like protein
MRLGVASVCLYLMMGCAAQQMSSRSDSWDSNDSLDDNLVAVSYTIADKLAENAARFIGPSDPLIVASFVNVNNLEESSGFGRIIAEQIASRFVQRGQKIIELKLRQNSIFIKEGKGEFMLSRDIRELSQTHNASAVVVGTYAEGGDRLYVSARIIRPTDNIVISAYDAGISMDPMAMNIMLMGR